jgi:hypothetical protein
MRPIRAQAEQAAVALALGCALLSGGCGGIGDSYVVFVDPAFSNDEQTKVVAALDSWRAAVPVHFSVQVARCSGIHDATICTHASTHQEIATRQATADGIGLGLTLRETTWSHVVDGGEVFIDVPTVEAWYAADFQRIVAHEVGHAMQLDHDAPGNLMGAMATGDAPSPTCADDSEWYAVRGEPHPHCG